MKVPQIGRRTMGIVLGVVIGGAGGFLFYKLIGCRTGACPITSNPYVSVAYGAVMGLLVSLPK